MGAVNASSAAELDVTSAIAGNGVNSIALIPASKNQVVYLMKESGTAPELVIEMATGSLAKAAQLNDSIALSDGIGSRTPASFGLQSNYPNPFNPETTIRYALAQTSNVKLRIFNVCGQLIRTLLDGQQEAGFQTVRWSGRNDNGQSVSSGVYFLRPEAGGRMFTQRLMLQK